MLTTPPIDRSGVAGVMRRWVLKSASSIKLSACEREVSWQELQRSDEVFMTNAVVGVKSVRSIAGGGKRLRFDEFDAAVRLRGLLELQ